MSTFKPKMYKSQNGCCICSVKSSRFTGSEKYSASFQGCFQVEDERSGDICNACVLIVKRWNKRSPSDKKNWAHVVDARKGPGFKIVSRPKKREEDTGSIRTVSRSKKKDEDTECLKYKHKYISKRGNKKISTVKVNRSRSNSVGGTSYRSDSPEISGLGSYPESGFIDPLYWRRTEVCCGLLFIGQLGEVMLDQKFYKKCSRSSYRQNKAMHESEFVENDLRTETPDFYPVDQSEKIKLQEDDLIEPTTEEQFDPDLEKFSCFKT